MPSHIFRFYSLEPNKVFSMAGKRWKSAIMRRNAWKIGGSVVWYATLVLDDDTAAHEFKKWLDLHAGRLDIRQYVGTLNAEADIYGDVIFHRGGIVSLLKLVFSGPQRRARRFWLCARRYMYGLYPRLKS